jgi:hypothetical protein
MRNVIWKNFLILFRNSICEEMVMYQISIATNSEREEILAFLEKQGLVVNAWLIWDVSDALQRCVDWESVMICRFHGDLVSVAYIINQRKIPRNPSDWKPDNDYDVHMDAVDRETVESLIDAFPTDLLGDFWVFRPMIQEYFQELPDATHNDGDLYFTVSPEHFRPVTGEKIIELTAVDAHLFEGCEKQRSREDMHRIFAILRNDRVATSVSLGFVTPKTAIKNRVEAIMDLYTETKYRRMGLGSQLVSHVTEMILHNSHVPVYWTEPENIASQGLAKGLGYWQVGKAIFYHWRKRA